MYIRPKATRHSFPTTSGPAFPAVQRAETQSMSKESVGRALSLALFLSCWIHLTEACMDLAAGSYFELLVLAVWAHLEREVAKSPK